MPQFQDLGMQKIVRTFQGKGPYLSHKKYGLFDQKVRPFCVKGTDYFCIVKESCVNAY